MFGNRILFGPSKTANVEAAPIESNPTTFLMANALVMLTPFEAGLSLLPESFGSPHFLLVSLMMGVVYMIAVVDLASLVGIRRAYTYSSALQVTWGLLSIVAKDRNLRMLKSICQAVSLFLVILKIILVGALESRFKNSWTSIVRSLQWVMLANGVSSGILGQAVPVWSLRVYTCLSIIGVTFFSWALPKSPWALSAVPRRTWAHLVGFACVVSLHCFWFHQFKTSKDIQNSHWCSTTMVLIIVCGAYVYGIFMDLELRAGTWRLSLDDFRVYKIGPEEASEESVGDLEKIPILT